MSSKRAKMPPVQRAKQFAPFDAVVGLRCALKEKEKIRVPKKSLSDDMAKEINGVLIALKSGDAVAVVYYNNPEQQYIRLTGITESVNTQKRRLIIGSAEINFDDIYSIQQLEGEKA